MLDSVVFFFVLIDDQAIVIMFTRRIDIILIELVASHPLFECEYVFIEACFNLSMILYVHIYTNELCALSFESA